MAFWDHVEVRVAPSSASGDQREGSQVIGLDGGESWDEDYYFTTVVVVVVAAAAAVALKSDTGLATGR